jgi:TRAP-type uncharacterized transport system substrate-binding protein
MILFIAGSALFLLLAWIAICAFRVQTIRVAVGPEGGTYDLTAHRYISILKKKGFDVELVHYDNTDEIAQSVDDIASDVDVGFSALNENSKEFRHLVSLGEIEIQPIFIFSRNTAYRGGISTFADLRGSSLVLPPERSVTSQAMLEIFQKFRVDRQNTKITFLPLKDAIDSLRAGRFDAGLFILSADNPYIVDLAVNTNLTMNSIGGIDSLVKKFSFLRRTVLPTGIYDLERTIPKTDVALVATGISVVVKKSLPPASVYALLEAMSEEHRQATYVSQSGEFPTSAGSALTVHPLARDYYRSGTPWMFSNLPPGLANLIDRYLVALLAFWFLVGLRQRFEEAVSLRFYLMHVLCGVALRWMERSLEQRKQLSEMQRWGLEKVMHWIDRDSERDQDDIKKLLVKVRAAVVGTTISQAQNRTGQP